MIREIKRNTIRLFKPFAKMEVPSEKTVIYLWNLATLVIRLNLVAAGIAYIFQLKMLSIGAEVMFFEYFLLFLLISPIVQFLIYFFANGARAYDKEFGVNNESRKTK